MWWDNHRPLFVKHVQVTGRPKDRGAGVLLLKVEKDVITQIERVHLADMEKASPNSSWTVLLLSRP